MKFHRENSDNLLTRKMIEDMEAEKVKHQKINQEKQEEKMKKMREMQKYENRRTAYPDIAEQLDMLWHDMNDGKIKIDKRYSNTWFHAIKNVKESNPL